MRKLLFALITIGYSHIATAEWVHIVDDDQLGGVYIYYGSVKINGNFRDVWELIDHKTLTVTPRGTDYLSVMMKVRYDCVKEKRQVLAAIHYSHGMGKGYVVERSNRESESLWHYVPPVSREGDVMNAVCRF